MVLTEKQIKKVQEILKKVGPFKMRLGYDSKNWLEDMESARTFLDAPICGKLAYLKRWTPREGSGGIQCKTFSNLTMPSCATISKNSGVQTQFFSQL